MNKKSSLPSSWFREMLKYTDDVELYEKWNEYLGWKEDGYSHHFALVRIGLADADY